MDNPESLSLVDSILVYHPGFEKAISRIEQCYTFAQGAAEPICLAVIGEARTGKSRALDACWLEHPPRRLNDGMNVPILRVSTPSRPTVKGLAEVMLEGLGAPDPKYSTENERTRRLKILMKGTQTRMLMVDEFQHFVDKGKRQVMHNVADWLKILADDLKCALVVAGLPSCRQVIDQNEQLAGRFQAPVRLSRFHWSDGRERDDFLAILYEFDQALRGQFEIPEFDAEPMAFRFYCATGGLIGYLAKLLRQAVCNAVTERRSRISLEHLDIAETQSIWHEPSSENPCRPFGPTFVPIVTQELLDQALRIGTVLTPIDFTPRSIRPRTPKSANTCLRR